MRSKLLQAQSDTLLLVVEIKDNNVEFLVKFNNFLRIAYAAPREVSNMDQTIYATQVDKYTIGSDILNGTLKNLSFFELTDNFFLLLFQLSFDKSLVRNNHILEFLVDLNNLEFHCFANEYIVVADRLHIDLRTRQESFDAEYIYDHTTLGTALDESLDNFFVFQSSVNAIPRTSSASLAVRQNELSFFVFLIFNIYFYSITDSQFRVVTEFTHRNDTV